MNALTFTALEMAKGLASRVARVATHQATKVAVVIAGFAGVCEGVSYVASAHPVAALSVATIGFITYATNRRCAA